MNFSDSSNSSWDIQAESAYVSRSEYEWAYPVFLSDTEKMMKKAMEAREKKRHRSLGGGPFLSQNQQGCMIESAVLRPPPKSAAACVVDLGPANKYNKQPLLDLAPRNKPWQRRKSFNWNTSLKSYQYNSYMHFWSIAILIRNSDLLIVRSKKEEKRF